MRRQGLDEDPEISLNGTSSVTPFKNASDGERDAGRPYRRR
jgi:hypothetical protein